VSLARAINDAHAASPYFVEDFVVTQAPLLIRDIDFTQYAFKSRSRNLAHGFQSLTQ
jgi:hypothetical protein